MNRSHSTWHTTSLLTFSSLAFFGCASSDPSLVSQSSIDQNIPSTWNHQSSDLSNSAPVELSYWWQRFNDPVLTNLIESALENNTNIRSALSSIRQARAERGLSASDLWPSISGNVGASGSKNRNRITETTSSSDNFSASIDARWEIDLFGQQAKWLEASDAELAATVEDFHNVQVSLAAEVAITYLSLRSSESQLEFVKQNLNTRESTLQIIQWQEQAGESDALSTQQSIASVEQARAQIPQLEQNITEIRNSLATLIGKSPNALQSISATATFPNPPERIALQIPAETLKQRPDIRSALRTIDANTANLSATERSRLPTLDLTGSIGIEAFRAGDLFDPQHIIGSAIASLTATIWDAGQTRRNIEIQTEHLTQAYLNYEASVLDALSEVESALSRIDNLDQQLASLQRASSAASDATKLAQLQYESGESDLLTVLVAQRTELDLDQNRISTQAAVLQAHVQLYKALGGGWSVPSALTQL